MNHDLVIHVNHLERKELKYALGYVRNYSAALANEAFKIVVLVNGPAVKFFRRTGTEFAEDIAQLLCHKEISFVLCNHALEKNNMTLEDVVKGCRTVPAGIVELVRLQEAGYSYVKP